MLEATVCVEDGRRRKATVPLQVFVVGEDEFEPVFSKPSFTFQVALSLSTSIKLPFRSH